MKRKILATVLASSLLLAALSWYMGGRLIRPQNHSVELPVDNSYESPKRVGELLHEGVLLFGEDQSHYGFAVDTLSILDLDGSPYAKIWKTVDGFIEHSDNLIRVTKSIRILSQEPDIIVFDAIKEDAEFKVLVNGEWKRISHPDRATYKPWSEFIADLYISVKDKSPLRVSPSVESDIIEGWGDNIFEVEQVKADWLKIVCSEASDPSSTNPTACTGWVKWREGNRLLVDLGYII